MAECAAWFHPEHFAAVVEERASLVRSVISDGRTDGMEIERATCCVFIVVSIDRSIDRLLA